jgi:HSP20 family protein
MSLPVRSPRAGSRWDPFRELDQLYDRMNHLWEAGAPDETLAWVPLADVEETDDAYLIEVDLPGVEQDDITIEVNGRELTVSGEIKEKERKGILRRRTRKVGEFQYAVTLPGDIDADNVSARLENGVLTVVVPKSQRAKPRRIAVGS